MRPEPLSADTERRLAALFARPDRDRTRGLLVEACGATLPFAEGLDAAGLERVRYAVLKLSGGDLERLREAVKDARVDARDVLMAAGFGGDRLAHTRWFPDR